jgi:hypothetical protein
MNTCAPNIKYENNSCISLELLIEIVNAYNKYIMQNENYNETDLIITPNNFENDKLKIYYVDVLNDKLKECNLNQKCWIEQPFIKFINEEKQHELKKLTFRPNGPAYSNKWLNTTNITNVLRQYENKYITFKYLGTYPIDFYYVPDKYFEKSSNINLKHVNFDDYKNNNKSKFGCIFNLDEHYKSGSHWVSLYIDFENGEIYFFDSVGYKPDERIKDFIKICKKYYLNQKNKNENMIIKYNKNKHQYGDSECGVYSINFILRLLRGDNFDKISNNKILDEKMKKCRKIYFNDI